MMSAAVATISRKRPVTVRDKKAGRMRPCSGPGLALRVVRLPEKREKLGNYVNTRRAVAGLCRPVRLKVRLTVSLRRARRCGSRRPGRSAARSARPARSAGIAACRRPARSWRSRRRPAPFRRSLAPGQHDEIRIVFHALEGEGAGGAEVRAIERSAKKAILRRPCATGETDAVARAQLPPRAFHVRTVGGVAAVLVRNTSHTST